MLWMLLSGCLIDRGLYEERRALLTDDDGDRQTEVEGDCDDLDPLVFAGAAETCDGRDEDCDGQVDEAADLVDAAWFADTDRDGSGGGSPVHTCDPPEGFVYDEGDCDDTDPGRYPAAPERCNGLDDDCDGETDEPEEVETLSWYTDADADGYGVGEAIEVCADPGGAALQDGDCDDAEPAVNPGVQETCNGLDDDCDGAVDDAPAITWYLDRDADGYGDDGATYEVCSPPPGYSRLGGDCDDTDGARGPGAAEECEDGIDADCDGLELACGLLPGEHAGEAMSARFAVSDMESYVARGVASAGDLDGDGDDELLVTRVGRDALAGGVALVPGRPELFEGEQDLTGEGALLTGLAGSAFGYDVSAGEDADGDGTADVLVSAVLDDEVYLFTDGALTLGGGLGSGDAGVTFVAAGSDGSFGASVSLLGDVDGDGTGDLIVGDDGDDGGRGAGFLFYGPFSGGTVGIEEAARLASQRDAAQAGQEVASLGDIDGDGVPDFVVADNKISSTGESSLAAVYVGVSGRLPDADLADAPLLIEGSPDEGAFLSATALGDVDRDGHMDAAFTAPLRNEGAGSVFVLLGDVSLPASGTLEALAGVEWTGSRADVGLGHSVAGPGDLDGDGYPEIATSGARTDASTGALYLLPGASSLAGVWSEADAWFVVHGGNTEAEGDAIAGALDTNGDGAGDLFFGAWDTGSAQGQAWLVYGAP